MDKAVIDFAEQAEAATKAGNPVACVEASAEGPHVFVIGTDANGDPAAVTSFDLEAGDDFESGRDLIETGFAITAKLAGS